MNAMFDTVVRHDAAFDVLEFRIGRTNEEPSFVSMRVTAKGAAALTELLEELVGLGCRVARPADAQLTPADRDGRAPEDFYSTTNHRTFVRLGGAPSAAAGATAPGSRGANRHRMRAINAISRAGGRRAAVQQGVLTSGVMYECIRRNVEYVLAGSIRDDGPLPDTIMNLVEAQDRYTEALRGVSLVLVLSTMLHGIGVGNMLPSWVRLVCVDINPAVVNQLADRGSSQTLGIVTDVGLFLHRLAQRLRQGSAEPVTALRS